MTVAAVECEDGVYLLELDAVAGDAVLGMNAGETLPDRPRPVELVPSFASSHLVDLDALGSTVVLVLERRPPLLVSHDGGLTWNERGGGLPRGRAIALGETPDAMLYGARNRVYVSLDGGVFWRAADVELPEIRGVAWG
jgi:hypothetical protein